MSQVIKKNCGLTIIELVVATALGLVISTGAVFLMSNTMPENVSPADQGQERGFVDLALTLTNNLKRAGYTESTAQTGINSAMIAGCAYDGATGLCSSNSGANATAKFNCLTTISQIKNSNLSVVEWLVTTMRPSSANGSVASIELNSKRVTGGLPSITGCMNNAFFTTPWVEVKGQIKNAITELRFCELKADSDSALLTGLEATSACSPITNTAATNQKLSAVLFKLSASVTATNNTGRSVSISNAVYLPNLPLR
jgi:hypothetical protein